jgi:integrase
MAHVTTVARKTGVAYEVHWRDGAVKRMQTFKVKREAERHAIKVETELAAGNSTAPLVRNTKTFRQVAEASLAASKGRLKPRTHDGYVQMYAKHVYPTFGSRRISTITSAQIERWLSALAETPAARTGTPLHPSTIKHAFVAANKVFRYAIKHRIISHNPATGADLPMSHKPDEAAPMFLSPAEIEALASELDNAAPDGLFVRMAAYTGLRAGEIQALQIRDVNLLRRSVQVRRTLARSGGVYVESTPKSEKSIRTVKLRRELAAQLETYLAEHPRRDDPTAPLWPGRFYGGYGEYRGALDWTKRMDYESFYRRRFRPTADKLGLKGLRFHDLRHTAASLFAGSGMPLARVAQILGHADTATTYKVYLHFFPDDFDSDMDRLDAYIDSPTTQETAPVALRPVRSSNGQ